MGGPESDGLHRIDALVPDRAQMGPTVSEVELVDEPFTGSKSGQGGPVFVEHLLVGAVELGIRRADPLLVAGPELVEVGAAPARERVVDRDRELVERVRAGGGEHAPRSGPEVLAVSLDEVDTDRQPGATHPATISGRSVLFGVGAAAARSRPPRIGWGGPRRLLDDLAHARVTGKEPGDRRISGDLGGFYRVKFDLPIERPRRFRLVKPGLRPTPVDLTSTPA
jgi:hypothetical protein